jgi:prevent-host-death family protein
MITVNIHEAKTNFSKLIEAVLHGEEIMIAKAGIPVARLVPIAPNVIKRKPGALKGKIKISADFDKPLPDEILNLFEDN